MSPPDLMEWALALIVAAFALAAAGAVTVVFTRFMEEQRANLAAHRARRDREIAEAKAAEQRAELEAEDVLQRRLALPFGGTATEAQMINTRLDRFAETVQRMQGEHRVLARALETRAVTHTDRPLRPGEGRR